jgi:hypothetical protein
MTQETEARQELKLKRISHHALINAFDSAPNFYSQLRNLADAQLQADQKDMDTAIREKDREIADYQEVITILKSDLVVHKAFIGKLEAEISGLKVQIE